MIHKQLFASVVRQAIFIFLVAVTLNYVWEVAQAPLYVGLESWRSIWWHCFAASLGDGILLLIMHAIGWTAFRRPDWYVNPTTRTYALMLGIGLAIGVGVEWTAINVLQRWSYMTSMPVLPGLGVGLVPILQMLILPPLIFLLVARWTGYQRLR